MVAATLDLLAAQSENGIDLNRFSLSWNLTNADTKALWQRLGRRVIGDGDAQPYHPPRVRNVSRATGTPEADARQLFKRLARAGELYPIARDHYLTADAVAELADIVRQLNEEHGAVHDWTTQ